MHMHCSHHIPILFVYGKCVEVIPTGQLSFDIAGYNLPSAAAS